MFKNKIKTSFTIIVILIKIFQQITHNSMSHHKPTVVSESLLPKIDIYCMIKYYYYCCFIEQLFVLFLHINMYIAD